MSKLRVQLSHLDYFCAWTVRATFYLWPVAVAAATRQTAVTSWAVAAGGVIASHLLFSYTLRRCSSARLSFWNGLLVVAHSMRTGWLSMSAALALPALLFTIFASLVWACLGDLRRNPDFAPERFEALVKGFYHVRVPQ